MKESNNYLEDLFGLEDKTVLVTGAAGQLGKVLCQGFLDAGSKVIGIDLIIDGGVINGSGSKIFLLDNDIWKQLR